MLTKMWIGSSHVTGFWQHIIVEGSTLFCTQYEVHGHYIHECRRRMKANNNEDAQAIEKTKYCTRCHLNHHSNEECRLLLRDKDLSCSHCKRNTHSYANCWTLRRIRNQKKPQEVKQILIPSSNTEILKSSMVNQDNVGTTQAEIVYFASFTAKDKVFFPKVTGGTSKGTKQSISDEDLIQEASTLGSKLSRDDIILDSMSYSNNFRHIRSIGDMAHMITVMNDGGNIRRMLLLNQTSSTTQFANVSAPCLENEEDGGQR